MFKCRITLISTNSAFHAQKGGYSGLEQSSQLLEEPQISHLYTNSCRFLGLLSIFLKPCSTSVLSYLQLSKQCYRLLQ